VAFRWTDPGPSRALVLGGLAALFAVSALTDLRALAAAAAAATLLFRRGLGRNLARAARSVLPVTLALSALSWGFLWLVRGDRPDAAPFLALALRTAILAFVTFSVLDRANLFRALEPWPTASRLLVVTLAQIHALRLVASESRDGLRSRLVRPPRARDVVRNAGGLTAALFSLSTRNAREITEAMRSRGF
jgi:cobalt/nickel transport system permease protein